MRDRKITILGSGVALGVYIPALILNFQLRRLGLDTEVVLLEDLYDSDGLRSLETLRRSFHENFKLAKIAQRMTSSLRPHLDPGKVKALLCCWRREDRRDFVVWSGFWVPLLEEYRSQRAQGVVHADLCRIDATISPSFDGHQQPTPDDQEIWFWNWNKRCLEHELPVTSAPAIPYQDRAARLVVHGGGWGLGDYQDIAVKLEERGLKLDKVVYRRSETKAGNQASRTFMVAPDWRAWLRDPGRQPEPPPFGEVTNGIADGSQFKNREECHELYTLIRHSRAIISKPGGGTLMDSLSSATPVVFLAPYGAAEQNNANLWIHLGFGVSYDEWKASGFDIGLLERLHDNLLNRKGETVNYPNSYAERLEHRCSMETTGV